MGVYSMLSDPVEYCVRILFVLMHPMTAKVRDEDSLMQESGSKKW